jgi:hypothetical protein
MKPHNRPLSRLLVIGVVDAEALPCLCISPLTSSSPFSNQVLRGNLSTRSTTAASLQVDFVTKMLHWRASLDRLRVVLPWYHARHL